MPSKEEIEAEVNLVDFINKTVAYPLKKYGDSWKGAVRSSSKGKTSLIVGPEPNKWHDYNTGVGGTGVSSWVSYRDGLTDKKDYPVVAKTIIEEAGLKIKTGHKNDEKEKVFNTLLTVVGFYHSQLTDEHRLFLWENWGISNETIDELKIGFAPRDGGELQMALKDVVHQDDLIECGIIYPKGKNSLFQGRYVFPYWKNGKVVYLAGRDINEDTNKKYIKLMVHSRHTEVSEHIENNTLYGIDSISGVDYVIITEGVTDCISMLQAGIPCISPVTNNFSKNGLKPLYDTVKNIKTVYICNDNDGTEEEEGAGDKGAFKTIDYLTENRLEVRYIQLPRPDDVDKIDLAEYMKGHTVEDFRSLMDNAVVHKPGNVTRSYRMNDTGNAQRMNDLYGDDVRYCYGSNEWFIWKGKIWVIDKTGTIQEFASSTADSIHDEAESMEDSDFKKKMQKYASSCGQLPKINNMIKRLQSIENIPVLIEDFDLNDMILPVQNGTLELRTGKLRESKRIDMCSKIANVFYDPAAKCPEFMKFYEQIQPNRDTRQYLQKVLGYGLTGDTSEEQVFFNLGNGWNGKNTLMDIIVYILGDFAINIDSKTILTSDTQTSTTDYEVARMKGARLVTASEPEAGKTLNDAQIKKVTNSKALITARRLYQEPFDYYPTHKLFFSANQRPYVKDNTNGTWRRIRIIPFNVKITEDSRDAGLPDRLRAETPGILNWLIEGCLMWQAEGLKMCAEVELATAEYKADMDIVTEFLNEYTIKGDYEKTISNTMLREQYNEWALIRGYKKLTPQTFSSKMRERGHEGTIYRGSRVWHSLILKDIDKRTSGGLVVDLKGMETLPGGLGGLNSKSLENKKKNIGNGSCNIDTKNNIENLSSPESPPSPPDSDFDLDKSTASPFEIYLTKEQKNQLIEDVVKDHGETPTKGNVMYLAGLVHKRKDAYSLYEAAADIKIKYNFDVKPSKEANDKLTADLKSGNGVLPEIERRLKKKYAGDDLQNLYNIIQEDRHKQNGDNGKLKPIDDIDSYCNGLLGRNAELRNYKGPTKDILKIVVEYDNNGGGST